MTRSRKKGKSGAWLKRQNRDPYVRQARQSGYRARAVFKLEQIDRKQRLLKPGARVVDLGSAPGSWAQYAVSQTGGDPPVIAVDLLPMTAVPGVEFIQGDFTEQSVIESVLSALGGRRADLVLSDMAPNISGVRSADQARAAALQESIAVFCRDGLRRGGKLLTKVFEGESLGELRGQLGRDFEQVNTIKPDASRAKSREVYLLASGYRAAGDDKSGGANDL